MNESFTGTALGRLGTLIKCAIICVCTLGFGVPIAICIWRKWLADHTMIDGHQLSFDGRAGDLFGIWIVNAILTSITGGLYSLWGWIKVEKWITAHTHIKA